MKYCSRCGAGVTSRIPSGDDRPRFVCDTCQTIHYENPKIVVGTIPEQGDRILLCRRAIRPRLRKWTLPAGYLENGETLVEAATREAYEEARAKLTDLAPYALFNLTFVNQVYVMFRCRLKDRDYRPGPESSEVRLFAEQEIPWEDMAFSTIRETLRRYFMDRRKGTFPLHMADIAPD
ncbi:MAG: NUDIX hydrolase [Thermodesulfobacteriota bacterium]|nr:NUDIX hydrolase [Thermodesulfobacteriota bacterium]